MRALIYLSLLFFVVDLAYKTINNISYLNRQNCILYKVLPKFWFLFFEYFIELFFIIMAGIFAAVLLGAWFSKYSRFYPKNSVTAFLYASLLPVCACSTIPMIGSMRGRLPFRAIITFVVAAPLLSPYIVVLSFSVLGMKYALLRISAAFMLAVLTGWALERFCAQEDRHVLTTLHTSAGQGGAQHGTDVYTKTYEILKGLLPYFFIAATVGMAIEYAAPVNFLTKLEISNNIGTIIISILLGIPIYLCHGAEILLLRPLIHQGGFSDGAAIAFSLASTSICVTSLVMLFRFLGKRATVILLLLLICIIFFQGLIINAIF